MSGATSSADQQFVNFPAKLSASQPHVPNKKPTQANSMLSSGPQPSTSASSANYNNVLRGLANGHLANHRDSHSLQSAKISGGHAPRQTNVYKSNQHLGVDQSGVPTASGLSVNGVNEKLIYKGGA